MPGDSSTFPPVVAVFQADTSTFDEKVDAIEEKLDSLDSANAEPEVDLQDEEAEEQIDDIQERIDALDATVAEPDVTLDDVEAEGALDGFEAQLDELDEEVFAPTIFLDTAPAETNLADLEAQMAANTAEAEALRATLAVTLSEALAQIDAESAEATTRGDLLATALGNQAIAATGAAAANQDLTESLAEVQAAYDAGTISAEEYAAATALSDDEADALEARFNGLMSGSTHALKQIGITEVIARLTAMGLVARSAGNDFADLDGNLITQGQILSKYGVVLTDQTVAIGSFEQALGNSAADGLEPVSFALSELDPSLQAFAEDMGDAVPATSALSDGIATAAAAFASLQAASNATAAGFEAADEADAALAEGLAAMNGELGASDGFLASFAAALQVASAATDESDLSTFGTSLPWLGKIASGLTSAVAGVSDLAGALSAALPDESSFGGALGVISHALEAVSESSVDMAPIVIGALSSLLPILAVTGGAVLGLAGGLLEGVVAIGVFAAAAYGAGVSLTELESKVKSAFSAWASAYRSTIQDVINELPGVIEGVLGDMTPVLQGAISGFRDMFALINEDVHSSDLVTFFKWVGSEAQAGAVTATEAFQSFSRGLSMMAENASPFITMLETGIIHLGNDFARYATSPEFEHFISYIVSEAPTVSAVLSQVWGSAEKLTTSLMSLGAVTLPIVEGALGALHIVLDGASDAMKVVKTVVEDWEHVFAGAYHDITRLIGLIPGVNALGNALAAAKPSGWVTSIGGFFEGVYHYAEDVIHLIPGTQDLSNQMLGLGAATTAAGKKAGTLANDTENAHQAFKALSTSATTAKTHLTSLARELGVSATAAKKLEKAGATAAKTVESSFKTAESAVKNLGSTTTLTASKLDSFYSKSLSTLKTFGRNLQAMVQEGYKVTIIEAVMKTATSGPALAALYSAGGTAMAHYVNGVTSQEAAARSAMGQIASDMAEAVRSKNGTFTAAAKTAEQALAIEMQAAGKTSSARLAAGIIGGLPALRSALAQYPTLFTTTIRSALTKLLTDGKTAPANLAEGMKATTPKVTTAATYMAREAVIHADAIARSTAIALGKRFSTSTAKGITTTASKVDHSVTKVVKKAIDAGKAVTSRPVGRQMMSDISTAITNHEGEIQSALVGDIHRAIAAAKATTARSIGSDLDSGIAGGIHASSGVIAAAAASAAQSAITSAKAEVGAKSPSTVARYEIGQPIGQGIALGIIDMKGLIAAASEEAAMSAITSGKSASGLASVSAAAPSASAEGGTGEIHNHFYVDGKEIATAVAPAVRKATLQGARRHRDIAGNWAGGRPR